MKWVGYPDEDNTWEPLENCNCPELIEEFEKKREAKLKENDSKKQKEREAKQRTAKNSKGENGRSDETVSDAQILFCVLFNVQLELTVLSAGSLIFINALNS